MMSYGSRLETFKKSVIAYIENKVANENGYRNKPGDLIMCNNEVYVVHEVAGRMKLRNHSLESLCVIADKIHFRPLGDTVRQISKQETNIEKTSNMNFEIKNDIPVPTKAVKEEEPKELKSKTGRLNYLNLPLRAMKRGEVIVLFEGGNEKEAKSRKYSATTGIRRAADLIGLPGHFHVDITDDNKVCVWRVQ